MRPLETAGSRARLALRAWRQPGSTDTFQWRDGGVERVSIALLPGRGPRGIIGKDKDSGETIRLTEDWSGKSDGDEYYKNRAVSRFLSELKVRVENEKVAVEMVQLAEQVLKANRRSARTRRLTARLGQTFAWRKH